MFLCVGMYLAFFGLHCADQIRLIGSAVAASQYDLKSSPGVSAAIVLVGLIQGLAVAALVAALGHISGGHLNPAVSLSLMVVGKMPTLRGVSYIFVQILGKKFSL